MAVAPAEAALSWWQQRLLAQRFAAEAVACLSAACLAAAEGVCSGIIVPGRQLVPLVLCVRRKEGAVRVDSRGRTCAQRIGAPGCNARFGRFSELFAPGHA